MVVFHRFLMFFVFEALIPARFMGSTHVVVGHLFAKGVTEPIYFFGWGFTWVFLACEVHWGERKIFISQLGLEICWLVVTGTFLFSHILGIIIPTDY